MAQDHPTPENLAAVVKPAQAPPRPGWTPGSKLLDIPGLSVDKNKGSPKYTSHRMRRGVKDGVPERGAQGGAKSGHPLFLLISVPRAQHRARQRQASETCDERQSDSPHRSPRLVLPGDRERARWVLTARPRALGSDLSDS